MSDKKSIVSIVIPHWNNVDILTECLESISATDFDNFEIIVVDNASSDNSVSWVKSNYPNVKLIENNQNYGYAGGCNIGAEAAIGDYIIFFPKIAIPARGQRKVEDLPLFYIIPKGSRFLELRNLEPFKKLRKPVNFELSFPPWGNSDFGKNFCIVSKYTC